MSIRIIKTGLVAASRRGFAVNPIRYNCKFNTLTLCSHLSSFTGHRNPSHFLVIQPSRSFFNKADNAEKAKAEQAANAEQSEQNVRLFFEIDTMFSADCFRMVKLQSNKKMKI